MKERDKNKAANGIIVSKHEWMRGLELKLKRSTFPKKTSPNAFRRKSTQPGLPCQQASRVKERGWERENQTCSEFLWEAPNINLSEW